MIELTCKICTFVALFPRPSQFLTACTYTLEMGLRDQASYVYIARAHEHIAGTLTHACTAHVHVQ